MTVKKLNVKKLIAVILAFLLVIGFIGYGIYNKKLKESIEYKLETHGYSEADIKTIKKNYDKEEAEYLLTIKYDENILKLAKEKYFKFDKLTNYLEYYKTNSSLSLNEVITKINTHTNLDFYDEIYDTDTSKKELMLVNKFYKLNEDYEPEDLILVPSTHAYSGKYISKSIYDAVISLIDAAREKGYTLVVSQGYRSYIDQSEAYDSYKMNNGIRDADTFVARPGHSDYQTGLGLIIKPYNKEIEDVTTNEEYIWITDNAHKFGFIRRYPESKEDITGFKYDPWRLRYVGVDASTYIHKNNITFDEYYAWKFE